MAKNDALFNALNFQNSLGNDITTSVNNVKGDYGSATIDDWANAIHLVWITTITLSELEAGLQAVGTFSAGDITTAAEVYFLEIQIAMDTTAMLSQPSSSSPIFVDQYIVMTSNHQSATSGQGTNELVAKDLQPNESIFWKAISSSNTSDTIQLKKFHPSPINPNADFSQMIAAPKQVNGKENEYYTYVKSNPVLGLKYAYSFDFTINDGTQVFTFDPWLED